jgi:hypothetical protein
MKAESLMKTVMCKSAEEFLDEMNPTRGRLWEKSRSSLFSEEEWIFRGVACESYALQPSSFRENAFVPFMEAQKELLVETGKAQRDLEDHYLIRFCTQADRMGIHVPGDRPEVRDPRRAPKDYNPLEFPPIEKLHMAALAQHYGVPTRLLDWTRHPRVAAYLLSSRLPRSRGTSFVLNQRSKETSPALSGL